MAVMEIDVDALEAALDAGARLFDVREVDEYEAGHVDGAILIPLGTVPTRAEEFRGDGPAYIICRSGARSMRAAEHLERLGIEAINVAGGTLSWIRSGRPVVDGDQPS